MKEFPLTEDFIGYSDRFKVYNVLDEIVSVELWADLANQLIKTIQEVLSVSMNVSATQQSILVKKMQKGLARREEDIIHEFEEKHVSMINANDFISKGRWRATLGVLARCIIDLIKNDMCSGSTSSILEMTEMVQSSFTEPNVFAVYSTDLLSSLYYIAGWHMTACLKAGKIRAGKKMDGQLGKLMIELFECGTVNKADAIDLPSEKVIRSEMFGGLSFVSRMYYEFILRIEYVFVKSMTSAKLAVLGNTLVQRVYQSLCESIPLRKYIERILDSDDAVDEEVMDMLVLYLVQTYCRMRGKDFCRQVMATNFRNLGKGVRPTLAVLSDKLSYEKKEKVNTDEYNLFNNITSFFASNDIQDDSNEYDIISADELINMNII